MSSIRKVICLANSWKKSERCIAGIDIKTDKWVRPVCDTLYPEDGRIPFAVRQIQGREPKLLEIIQIPLAKTGNNFDFESENKSVLLGLWEYLGLAEPQDILRYCDRSKYVLHNQKRYVYPSYFQSLPFEERKTLQLAETNCFSVEAQLSSQGKLDWRGNLETLNGAYLEKAKITDPVLVEKLDQGYQPINHCLVTISLSMPWAYPDWDGDEIPCWKLIAGVIELK